MGYLLALGLGVLLTATKPGGAAPLLLAVALPGVLALSPRLRRRPALGIWIFLVLPTALALWNVSNRSGGHLGDLLSLGFAVSVLWWWTCRDEDGFLPLLGLALATFLVATFSGGAGSGGPMIAWLGSHGLAPAQAEAATFAFRKAVHLTFYGAVGWLGLRATDAVPLALGTALSLAAFDELRQSGFANRTGSARDVLLDLAGAATVVGLSAWQMRKKR